MEGRKLAGRGWNPLEYVEAFGSTENSLSRLLWTHKNVPETEFRFLLDLTIAVIALELPEQTSQQAYGCRMEVLCSKHAVIHHVMSCVNVLHE